MENRDKDKNQLILELEILKKRVDTLEFSEQTIKDSEERFQVIAEATGTWIWETDTNGLFTYSSPFVEKMTGYTVEEIVEKKYFYDLFPSDVREQLKEDTLKTFKKKAVFKEFENVLVRKNGTEIIVSTSASPMLDDEGNLVGYLGADTNITERKIAEKTLLESEERLRLALKSADQGFYDVDLLTGDATVSSEYATMLGYNPETFIETNQKWLERLHSDDTERVTRTFNNFITGKIKEYKVEFRQKTKNGKWIWILSMGSIVERDDEGNALRILGTHTKNLSIWECEVGPHCTEYFSIFGNWMPLPEISIWITCNCANYLFTHFGIRIE